MKITKTEVVRLTEDEAKILNKFFVDTENFVDEDSDSEMYNVRHKDKIYEILDELRNILGYRRERGVTYPSGIDVMIDPDAK